MPEPDRPEPQPDLAVSGPAGSWTCSLRLDSAARGRLPSECWRLRLSWEGFPVYERWLPWGGLPLRAWVYATGWIVLLERHPGGDLLAAYEPWRGQRCGTVGLSHLQAEVRASRGLAYLDYAQAGFAVLADRPYFALRAASGTRVLLDLERGAIAPGRALEDALARHEQRLARRTLQRLFAPACRPGRDRDAFGSAALVAVEYLAREWIPLLRRLEWAGGPCGLPSTQPVETWPEDWPHGLCDLHDLRRLAQGALLALGEEPRPLPGATVLPAPADTAFPGSLGERATALASLPNGLGPVEVLRRAGQPDSVGPRWWDYLVCAPFPATVRLRWAGAFGAASWLERRDYLSPWAALGRIGAFRRPLLGPAAASSPDRREACAWAERARARQAIPRPRGGLRQEAVGA